MVDHTHTTIWQVSNPNKAQIYQIQIRQITKHRDLTNNAPPVTFDQIQLDIVLLRSNEPEERARQAPGVQGSLLSLGVVQQERVVPELEIGRSIFVAHTFFSSARRKSSEPKVSRAAYGIQCSY